MRSISSALAVNIMIGMWRVAGSLFKILQTSRPGIFGNMRSRMMKTGFSARALCKPAGLTQVQRKQIDNVALVLDDQDSFAGGRLHSQQLFATELSCRVRHAFRCDSGLLVQGL